MELSNHTIFLEDMDIQSLTHEQVVGLVGQLTLHVGLGLTLSLSQLFLQLFDLLWQQYQR